MSIDTHWFSTMFGWYNFASWWVTGLATITVTVIFLKEGGYLGFVNENHLHDLGKLVFAFSIFWTYIWFSQFVLIYYANIPEETVYFVERLENPLYKKSLWAALFINFIFPFMVLMTRDAKRKVQILKIACLAVILGHWLDFYNMITPGTLKDGGSLGLLEIGLALLYFGVFIFWIGTALSKNPLVQKNHPMMEECLNHNI
jgi:magnesium-transporting ATPase (P-type)